MTDQANSTEGTVLVPADSLAAGVIRAEAAAHSLRNLSSLKEAAAALIEAANSIGCYQLVASNAAAEPLATAAALLSEGTISFSDKVSNTAQKVLIIDASTVTGAATRACAADLRAYGAAWVGSVIYDRVRPDLDNLDNEPLLDFVTTLLPH
ncbi:hypothetical protein CKJ65_23505 [Mycobacterium intracellulare]|uniref:hypothetical protein n=1 Tax=Mycobacterium intracellulare TaxID=1767 RepID=UPI000BC5A7D5|nr:hypothetical protein [Mycobacterium intracellulare]PBA29031.1 hypothetical protein CKJ65_23505 [Mycobacterium intracellulare]